MDECEWHVLLVSLCDCESFQTLQIEYQLTQPTTANSIKSTQMLVAGDSTQI